jgi:hypothetical protein
MSKTVLVMLAHHEKCTIERRRRFPGRFLSIFLQAFLRRDSTNLVGNGDRHAGVCPDDGTHGVHALHNAHHKLAAAHRADLDAVTNHKRARNELQCTAIAIFIAQPAKKQSKIAGHV